MQKENEAKKRDVLFFCQIIEKMQTKVCKKGEIKFKLTVKRDWCARSFREFLL